VRVEPLGDRALLVHLGDEVDEATLGLVRAAYARLTRLPIDGSVDVVAGMTTVAVHFDAGYVAVGGTEASHVYDLMSSRVRERLLELAPLRAIDGRIVEIPVRYGGASGPDIDEVARLRGFSPDEVAAIHAGSVYTVQMVGFAPGFPYLGGLDARLATPRRDVPRTRVAAGSVGIGGGQTGIYPISSPGGWQLIGRTPLRLFDPMRAEPALLRVGDQLTMRAIGDEEFRALDVGE